MKIAVIGAGVSGIIFAVNRKKHHPKDEIIVFEHLDKALKKILSTGNGKCNIGNKYDISYKSNNELVRNILQEYNYDVQNYFLNSLNIKTKLVNELSYPISESAVTVRNALLKAVDKYGIIIKLNSEVKDYQLKEDKITLFTNEGEEVFDKLVIAVGGKSSPKLGSDGSFVSVLEKHGYKLKEFQPALCPIYTKEKTKILDGTRVKAIVRLFANNKIITEEYGEVLFKEHGLSGIVIFNISRFIANDLNKQYIVQIDLLPDVKEEELKHFLKVSSVNELLEAYLHPNLVKYLIDLKVNKDNVIEAVKSLEFTFDKLYGFDNSQVSVGGISFNDIDEKLQSKCEKSVHFLGELLDYAAPCGGFNLMWAIATGLYLSNKI